MNKANDTLLTLLTELDISANEAKTYAALLALDAVSIRKLAVHTGINRGTTYESLKKLVALGLVSVNTHNSRERYVAESPERINEIIREKRRNLVDAAAVAKDVIPELLARKKITAGKPLVRYYEGDEGVVTILRDVLATCRNLPVREYCAYSTSPIRRYLYRRFPQFTKRRIAEGIHVKVIAVGEGGEIAENAERKWLSNNADASVSSYTIIYESKLAIISIAKDETPYGVVIEDEGTASMQRLLFEQLWRMV